MSNEPSYLVADIGGTNARFAIARGSVSRGFDLDQVRRLKNEDFEHLRDAAMAYLESCEGDRPGRACFAVASPIRAGRVQLTNATWSFRPDELGGELGMDTLMAVNDFEAQARGAPLTPSVDIVEISDGRPVAGTPVAVLGPGTGLGLGLLVPDGDSVKVVATEGGPAGFAPRTQEEIAVGRRSDLMYGAGEKSADFEVEASLGQCHVGGQVHSWQAAACSRVCVVQVRTVWHVAKEKVAKRASRSNSPHVFVPAQEQCGVLDVDFECWPVKITRRRA